MKRRDFFKQLGSTSLLAMSGVFASGKKADAEIVSAIVAVAAAVAGYIAARGNPTNSLILANGTAITGLSEKLDAIGEQLGEVSVSINEIYKKLLEVEHSIEKAAERDLNARRRTILGVIKAEKQAKENGTPLDTEERYQLVKSQWLDFVTSRNVLIQQSSERNFNGIVTLALNQEFELSLLNYLIAKNIDLGRNEIGIEDTLEAILNYNQYFSAALSEDKGSLTSLLKETNWKFGSAAAKVSGSNHPMLSGKHLVGCVVENAELSHVNPPDNEAHEKRTVWDWRGDAAPSLLYNGENYSKYHNDWGRLMHRFPDDHDRKRQEINATNKPDTFVCSVTYREVFFELKSTSQNGLETFEFVNRLKRPPPIYHTDNIVLGDTHTEMRWVPTPRIDPSRVFASNYNEAVGQARQFDELVSEQFCSLDTGPGFNFEIDLLIDKLTYGWSGNGFGKRNTLYKSFAYPPTECEVIDDWSFLDPHRGKFTASSKYAIHPSFFRERPQFISNYHAQFLGTYSEEYFEERDRRDAVAKLVELAELCRSSLECTTMIFKGDATCMNATATTESQD